MTMLVLVISTVLAFSSCNKDDDGINSDENNGGSTIVDGIDTSLIPGMYDFNGNIAPSFILYKDGTCKIESNGLSGSITKDKWTYEKTTHVLLVGTHVYTIKLLTSEKLVAEWTSVKYGTSVSSWNRSSLPEDSNSGNSQNYENGHEYVDLGLSVKWATVNIGANKPENYGWYFAWGETSPQPSKNYTWSSYKWTDHSSTDITMTKYLVTTNQVSIDGKKILDLEDDAAYVNWGGNWRMPTLDELNELKRNCTWTWTTQNGVNGYIVYSQKNSNSIFLPAAGCCGTQGLIQDGTRGLYWSSKLDKENSYEANNLQFTEKNVSWDNYSYIHRYFGLSVRAVCP